MRIVFMGTPDFAAKSLERLYDDGRDIVGVFTQPDKPKNRGMKTGMSPVKELALTRGTPVYQPVTLRDGTALDILKQLEPELITVVAYGKILPKDILDLPQLGCINIHGSILPKYRGSAPIQRAVLSGETETGVTAMYMAEAMDAGDIILIKKTDIAEMETSGELYDRLGGLGAQLLSETIKAIEKGTATRTAQHDAEATYAPPLTKELSPIDWGRSSQEILCQIRGLNPWPAATAMIGGITCKIFTAAPTSRPAQAVPGTVVGTSGGIEIAAGDGTIMITQLQAPGGKRMSAENYLRGHPL